MKAEEEEVDIDTVPEETRPRETQFHGVLPNDEDMMWADREPDDDREGWKLRLTMEEEWGI